MALWKNLGRKRWVQVGVGVAAAEYLRFVARTNKLILEPADIYERLKPDLPEAYSRRAENRMALGQYGLAKADIETYLRLSTGKSADDPDIMRAYQLHSECTRKARAAAGAAG